MTQNIPSGIDLSIVELFRSRTDAVQVFAITASVAFGDQDIVITIFPTGGAPAPVNNGNGTWTFQRPPNGTTTLYNVQAKISGGSATVQSLNPLPAPPIIVGSSGLTVNVDNSNGTQVSFAFSHVGTITWSLDGVNQGDPGGSPLVVVRNSTGGASKLVALLDTGLDGTSVPWGPFSVLPAVASAPAVSASGSTQSSPWGYASEAQADDIVAKLNLVLAAVKGLGGLS